MQKRRDWRATSPLNSETPSANLVEGMRWFQTTVTAKGDEKKATIAALIHSERQKRARYSENLKKKSSSELNYSPDRYAKVAGREDTALKTGNES
jgi:hypothetical protein